MLTTNTNTNDLVEQILARSCELRGRTVVDEIDQLYREFGRDTIHQLPVSLFTHSVTQDVYSVLVSNQLGHWFWFSDDQIGSIKGVRHSVTQPAEITAATGDRYYFILGYSVSINEWLLYSALSPEEQLLYKLKYG